MPVIWRAFVSLLLTLPLSACSVLTHYPPEVSEEDRFALLAGGTAPIAEPVTIHWNHHAVPYIEARNNEDLAFAVGYAHAHLRLGQLAVLRMVAQGRISEMAGPIPMLATVDHGLRMIDLCASGEASLEVMALQGRQWIEHFVRGINWYREQHPQRPSEYAVLDLEDTAFTERDIMCIARLASGDLTWAIYLKYLKLAEQSGWEQAFAHFLSKGTTDAASAVAKPETPLSVILSSLSKSGSNSLVLSGALSESGGALIANDPHVGLWLPNFWLLIGLHSPDYQAVGLMIPGVPVIGVGRNQHIGWGGTNMRAISSHLVDVSELPEDQISEETTVIGRRFWWSAERTTRHTPYGPILTDLDYFDEEAQPYEVALNWVGRHGSDEITALLKVSQAQDWAAFRNAFADYRVSAFNMLYADERGHIGMVPAYGQPILKRPEQTLSLVKQPDNPVVGVRTPVQQTNPFDPEAGFIASANNRPFENPEIPYGYAFSNSDRYLRMQAQVTKLKQEGERATLEMLKSWQRDTYSQESVEIRDLLVESWPAGPVPQALKADWNSLVAWNGRFEPNSRGAVIFEGLSALAWQFYVDQATSTELMASYLSGIDYWKSELTRWLREQPERSLQPHIANWLSQVSEDADGDLRWGDIQVQAQQPMLGLIPVIGERYSLPSYPGSGNNDTLLKGARTLGLEEQEITYGSSARHISDLADPDANYFVLHGGQDGWINSPQLADQTALWRRGEYIQMPLDMRRVGEQFQRARTSLVPQARQ